MHILEATAYVFNALLMKLSFMRICLCGLGLPLLSMFFSHITMVSVLHAHNYAIKHYYSAVLHEFLAS